MGDKAILSARLRGRRATPFLTHATVAISCECRVHQHNMGFDRKRRPSGQDYLLPNQCVRIRCWGEKWGTCYFSSCWSILARNRCWNRPADRVAWKWER